MIAKQFFEDLSAKARETLADSPVKDFGKNAKSMLGSAFNKMDLVTREEFDIQQQILIKTRLKLAELEARLAALEGIPPAAEAAETATETAASETAEPSAETAGGSRPAARRSKISRSGG